MSAPEIVCQNWLLKRSQVTRFFKKRYTVLTNKGRLYSFRRIDISKPLDLGQASLVWDIKWASVEHLGKNTWVIRFLDGEEVLFRTLPPFSESAYHSWLCLLVALSRGDTSPLSGQSLLSMEVYGLPTGLSLFAESEGSLFPLREDPGVYCATIPIRQSGPGSCMRIIEYSSVNDSIVSQSGIIPKYFFRRPKVNLPWSVELPESIILTGAGVRYTGKIRLLLDEDFQAYLRPVTASHSGTDSKFELAAFKFQIRRLIRIFEQIGLIQKTLTSVFRWEDPGISLLWLMYFSIVLLVFPQYVPALAIAHAIYACTINHPKWYHDDGVESPAEVSNTVVTRSRDPANDTITANAQNVITALTNKFRRPSADDSSIKNEIWENQRRAVGGSNFSASNLSVFDRPRWSDESGRIGLDPPGSMDTWTIDTEDPKTDGNGWTYNFRWASSGWHPEYTSWDFVRRRRWIPSTASPLLRPASPGVTPNIRMGSVDELDASNVSSVQAEFGLINDEYDESVAGSQPQQVGGLGSMLQEFKSTASVAQVEIGLVCTGVERIFAMFSWKDEVITSLVLGGLALIAVVLVYVPINIVVYLVIVAQFHTGYRSYRWKRVLVLTTMAQLVKGPLKTFDINGINGMDAQRLCTILNKQYKTRLSQKILCQYRSAEKLASWLVDSQGTFRTVRSWMHRDIVENVLDHVPPVVSAELYDFLPSHQAVSVPSFATDIMDSTSNTLDGNTN